MRATERSATEEHGSTRERSATEKHGSTRIRQPRTNTDQHGNGRPRTNTDQHGNDRPRKNTDQHGYGSHGRTRTNTETIGHGKTLINTGLISHGRALLSDLFVVCTGVGGEPCGRFCEAACQVTRFSKRDSFLFGRRPVSARRPANQPRTARANGFVSMTAVKRVSRVLRRMRPHRAASGKSRWDRGERVIARRA
jgi:hypothetical protein